MQHTDSLPDEELLLHLCLARITFLSFEEKKNLFKKLDSADSLALSSINDISLLAGRDIRRAVWNGAENLREARICMSLCRALNIRILLYFEPEFPELLRQISDCPYLLFCRGDVSLFLNRSVSVVGSRRISQEGKRQALRFAYDAAKDGCCVVSGLAIGADGFAHQGAINAYFDGMESGSDVLHYGRTIAVLPSGIDTIVPSSHKQMAASVVQTGGLLVSEYEPSSQTAKWHFVARNRIIAALSPATVVVEAPPGSGALITADFAADMSRDVLFLKAAFNPLAKKISERVQKQLEESVALNKTGAYKLQNSIMKFLKAGASVIDDYEDYCKFRTETPGFRSEKIKQFLLFEDEDGF